MFPIVSVIFLFSLPFFNRTHHHYHHHIFRGCLYTLEITIPTLTCGFDLEQITPFSDRPAAFLVVWWQRTATANMRFPCSMRFAAIRNLTLGDLRTKPVGSFLIALYRSETNQCASGVLTSTRSTLSTFTRNRNCSTGTGSLLDK